MMVETTVACNLEEVGQSIKLWSWPKKTNPVADLEGVPWNPPFCRQLEDQPAHGTVFSHISDLILKRSVSASYSSF